MARSHGRNGRIYIDISSAANGSATPVSFINSWTLDQTADKVEVTSLGDTTKTYVSGLADASGSMNGFVNMGTTTFASLTDPTAGARKLYLYPDATNQAGTYFFGTAFFDCSYEGGAGDALKVSMNWSAASTCAWVAGP